MRPAVRSLLRQLVPPLFVPPIRWARDRLSPAADKQLFGGDDALFKAAFQPHTVYGEYGCGASTIWVARTIGCPIFSVDTSPQWIETVRGACAGATVNLHLADLGPVGDWGRPLGYDRHAQFPDYTDWIWQQDQKPDVVLIDGRFRVCCFLTSLMHAAPGTKLLFDDYADRRAYHYVETYLVPLQLAGRQALFIVPSADALPREAIRRDVERFRFVFD